jgi:hypothetical protein
MLLYPTLTPLEPGAHRLSGCRVSRQSACRDGVCLRLLYLAAWLSRRYLTSHFPHFLLQHPASRGLKKRGVSRATLGFVFLCFLSNHALPQGIPYDSFYPTERVFYYTPYVPAAGSSPAYTLPPRYFPTSSTLCIDAIAHNNSVEWKHTTGVCAGHPYRQLRLNRIVDTIIPTAISGYIGNSACRVDGVYRLAQGSPSGNICGESVAIDEGALGGAIGTLCDKGAVSYWASTDPIPHTLCKCPSGTFLKNGYCIPKTVDPPYCPADGPEKEDGAISGNPILGKH